MNEPQRYLVIPVPMDIVDEAGDYERVLVATAETWEMPRPRRGGDWAAVIDSEDARDMEQAEQAGWGAHTRAARKGATMDEAKGGTVGYEEPQIVTVAHARRHIETCRGLPAKDVSWFNEWAKTIDRLAAALEAAGVLPATVEAIAAGESPQLGRRP